MASTQIQFRGGTTTDHASFTGAVREVTVDTTKDTLVVHDGQTQGGHPLVKASDLGTAAAEDSSAFATAAQGQLAEAALQPGDIGSTVQAFNAATVVDGAYVHTDNNYTSAEKSKLAGIESGAEANVNADWNASSGDAAILNKPSLGTAAAEDIGFFATAAQGELADSALQPADIGVSVQGYDANSVSDANYVHTDNNYTSAEKSKLAGIESGAEVNVNADWNAASGDAAILNKPTLGTAAAEDVASFASAAQGSLADTALQPEDVGIVLQPYDANLVSDAGYVHTDNNFTSAEQTKLAGIAAGAEANVNADWSASSGDAAILNKPTLGTASAEDVGYFATAAQGSLADSAVQPGDAISDLTNDAGYITTGEAPVQSVAGKTGTVTLVKGDVGLGNVNNTSDADKPISTATQAALDAKADLVGGLIPTAQLPSIAISEYLGSVASQAALLALSGQKGDWAIRSDLGSTWVITDGSGSQLADWVQLATPADAISSVNGFTGAVVLGPSDVGAATAAQGALADTALQPGDIGTEVQAYNANTVVDANYVHTDNNYTTAEKSKLAGIAAGAEVNVNPDWNASSGDAQILNKPTTLSGYGITDAQPLDADLTSIAGLVGTSGLLKKTAADTWSLDTSTYLTSNQNISVSGDASGSGSTSISLTLANSGVTAGTYNDSATAVRPFTVDAKGRLTGIGSAVTITPGWSSITSKPTTLAGYGITDAAGSTGSNASGTWGISITGNAATVTNGVYTTSSGVVTSAMIADGTIVDGDISASAAIADSKLASISTAGKVSGGAITSGTIGGSTAINTSGAIATSSTVTDSKGNVRSIPQIAASSSYTLLWTDPGKHISITTGGVTVPFASGFGAGDAVTIFNNSAANQTITQGPSVTMYLAGTATTGNRTLAQRGICTILCVALNTFVISGAGLT